MKYFEEKCKGCLSITNINNIYVFEDFQKIYKDVERNYMVCVFEVPLINVKEFHSNCPCNKCIVLPICNSICHLLEEHANKCRDTKIHPKKEV